ncbi:MAG: GAF domain-containing protein [Erysipelotrichaceae bacterium]|nr:GAF domain-containing protein [Erysipelotrichaceae bacterium]MDY5251663.1 GAF domain-containing protein [Erysipelotrichaceae bacterium]
MSILARQVALLCEEPDLIAALSNISACLNQHFTDINWVGFYLYKNDELVLGPFQGKVACTHIPMGKGVCGTSAAKQESIIVPDVHAFSGHIACDSVSASELVVPIIKDGKLFGVIDIDSPLKARFSAEDKTIIEEVADTMAKKLRLF